MIYIAMILIAFHLIFPDIIITQYYVKLCKLVRMVMQFNCPKNLFQSFIDTFLQSCLS